MAAYCYLPPSLVPPPSSHETCVSSSSSILSSFAIFNTLSAAFSMVMGHQAVRDRITPMISADRWLPFSAIASFILQLVAMIISTAIARRGTYQPAFWALFGMWTMRPRIGWIAFFWYVTIGDLYRWTILDVIFAECLLNIISLPFALHLVIQTNGQNNCQVKGQSPGGQLTSFKAFLGLNITVSLVSTFILAAIVLERLVHPDSPAFETHEHFKGRDDNSAVWDNWISGIIVTATIIGGLSFIWNYALWGVFIDLAKDAFCPSEIVGSGITWGFSLLLVAVSRPVLGGTS